MFHVKHCAGGYSPSAFSAAGRLAARACAATRVAVRMVFNRPALDLASAQAPTHALLPEAPMMDGLRWV